MNSEEDSLTDRLTVSYQFNIAKKRIRFFTRVVSVVNGFEGHTLHLTDPTASREEAFRTHITNYDAGLFDTVSFKELDKFRQTLELLQLLGSKIVLVRLPIYKDLYAIEEKAIGEFNMVMKSLEEIGVFISTLMC